MKKEQHFRNALRTAIKQILIEQEEKPLEDKEKPDSSKEKPEKPEKPPEGKKKPTRKKKTSSPGEIRIATGAVGGGRFSKFVGDAKARVENDPSGLMRDLGIKSADGSNDLEKILSILNTAIHTNSVMGEAYSGSNISQEQSPEGIMIKTVGAFPSGINNRNGIKFISHTLVAAKNAGILQLQNAIEINQGRNSPIVIYISN
jgi:hypothetical protein